MRERLVSSRPGLGRPGFSRPDRVELFLFFQVSLIGAFAGVSVFGVGDWIGIW